MAHILQSGPSDGKDKVKKGGSFMCHKVGVYYWYQVQFFLQVHGKKILCICLKMICFLEMHLELTRS